MKNLTTSNERTQSAHQRRMPKGWRAEPLLSALGFFMRFLSYLTLRRELLLGLMCAPLVFSADIVSVTVDENGNGVAFNMTLGIMQNLVFTIEKDPGPGGLALVLTYRIPFDVPSPVAGDVLISEPGGGLSDIVRFNPRGAGGVPGYAPALVFYSDADNMDSDKADIGLPTDRYALSFPVTEVGNENGNFADYHPGSTDPGFVSGFDITYRFNSDVPAVPEPPAVLLVSGAGLILMAYIAAVRRKLVSPGQRPVERINGYEKKHAGGNRCFLPAGNDG
jgi:hypothetical protein